jgi:hypothetical protein
VKRLFFMSVLVVDGLYSFSWYGSAGAGHNGGNNTSLYFRADSLEGYGLADRRCRKTPAATAKSPAFAELFARANGFIREQDKRQSIGKSLSMASAFSRGWLSSFFPFGAVWTGQFYRLQLHICKYNESIIKNFSYWKPVWRQIFSQPGLPENKPCQTPYKIPNVGRLKPFG